MKNLNLLLKTISFLFLVQTTVFAWDSNQNGYIDLDLNKDFTLIYGGSGTAVKGDFVATGNTIMDGTRGTTYFAGSSPVMLSEDTTLSALGSSDKNRNSSSAPLSLPSYVTTDHIIWAGLFWQGQIHDSANSTSEVDTDVNGWNTVRMKTPDGTTHTITSPIGTNTDEHSTYHYAHVRNGRYRFFHSSYVDVTNIVKAGGYTSTDNIFTVGNLMATDGSDGSSNIYFNHINEPTGAWYNLRMGHFGGWSLLVVYDVDGQTQLDNDVKYKNISIYNGFDLFSFWTGHAGDKFETTLDLSGFRTPDSGTISSKMLFFGGGGDYGMAFDTLQIEDGNNPGTFVNLTNSRNQGTQLFNGTYTNLNNDLISGKSYFQGMDLDIFNTSSMMAHEQTSTKIKFGVVQQSGYIDQVFPQIIGFSTELYTPDLCYDYTYGQGGHYTIAPDTDKPYIDDDFDSTQSLDIKLYIRNREASDVILTNTFMHIKDINISQAIYKRDSTEIKPPGGAIQAVPDDDLGRYVDDENDLNISIGTVGGLEYFYTYYSLDFAQGNAGGKIDMPINAYIQYDLSIDNEVLGSQELPLHSLPICQNSGDYIPTPGIFNVVHAAQTKSDDPYYYYNLPTQVVKRSGNFLLESMQGEPTYNESETATSTTVKLAAVEMLDVDGFHYVDATCTDPQITAVNNNKVWTIIDDSFAVPINRDELFDESFFDTAIANAAFRISYNTLNDGDWLQIEKITSGPKAGNYAIINFTELAQGIEDRNEALGLSPSEQNKCITPVVKGNHTFTTMPSACGNNADTNGLPFKDSNPNKADLITCNECIYGLNTKILCSRDNFSIRPEAFNIRLIDQNTTQTQEITDNTPAPNPTNLVAGYDYQMEVNATDHLNGMPTPRYHASDVNSTLVWFPTSSATNCNDTEDNESSINFSDGHSNSPIILNQVGRYTLQLLDSLWTNVDHESTFMAHHTSPYFNASLDCVINQNVVQSSTSSAQNGCDISSNHSNIENAKTFTDMNITFYPYTFNQSELNNTIGSASRTSGQSFIYMDTPSTSAADNTDMSYNFNGIFYASGKNGTRLSNFVTGCYADDLNMDLNYTYNSPPPTEAPYLSYSLQNQNTILNTVIRPASGTGLEIAPTEPTSSIIPHRISQAKTFFAKEMNGSIRMDLGYNFKRDYNKTVNPRYIEFKDFNITYVADGSQPTNVNADMESDYQIFGNKTLDTNVTFVYGRAKPSQDFYDDVITNSIATPISIVVYCDQDPITCSAIYNINTALGKTDEYDWYLSRGHVTSENDGNISLIANNGANVTSPVIINNSGGVNPNITVDDGGVTTRPLLVNIDFVTTTPADTSRWLIYNKSTNSVPSPFYRVRFIGQSDWAGQGNTGHVVDNNVSVKKNRRLGW